MGYKYQLYTVYSQDESFTIAVLLLSEYHTACSEEGAVQLINGESRFEGLVEVCDSGEWKSVCSNMWGSEEAGIVCRQIGFTGDLAR